MELGKREVSSNFSTPLPNDDPGPDATHEKRLNKNGVKPLVSFGSYPRQTFSAKWNLMINVIAL